MFNQEQKPGIINALGTIAGVNANAEGLQLMEAVVDVIVEKGIADVQVSDIQNVKVELEIGERVLTEGQASKILAAVEFHQNVLVASKKVREKKPTKLEEFKASTTELERDDIAAQVAELRINAEGTKPRAWRSIREELGLRNEEFHKLIRLSDGWHQAVCERIADLLDQEGGWEYNGKLEVLTGIDGFTMQDVEEFDVQ